MLPLARAPRRPRSRSMVGPGKQRQGQSCVDVYSLRPWWSGHLERFDHMPIRCAADNDNSILSADVDGHPGHALLVAISHL